MRFLVCSGIERAAGELFSVADTVPAARPRCCATVLSVTFLFPRSGLRSFFGVGVIRRASTNLFVFRNAIQNQSDRNPSGPGNLLYPEYSRAKSEFAPAPGSANAAVRTEIPLGQKSFALEWLGCLATMPGAVCP